MTTSARAAAPHRRSRRDRAVDITCVILSALLALLWATDGVEAGRFSWAYLAFSLVLAAAGCAALWWRRRWPIGVAVLLLPLGALTEAVGLASLVAVFTVAVHRRPLSAVVLAAAHTLVVVPVALLLPDPDLGAAGAISLGAVLTSGTLLWGMTVRARRRSVIAVRERAGQAEAQARRNAERLVALERQRIAREMHDVLAHRISLVSLHAGALEIRPDLPTADVARAAGTIRATAHQALEDLREILGVLRAAPPGGAGGGGHVRPQPGLADIAELVAQARSAGTAVVFEDRLAGVAVAPSSAGRTAYRIVQEGLTNARKHAPGVEVRVLLERTSAGELHVWLRNRLVTGSASPAVPGARSGLPGLTERVRLAGGRIDHGARRGAGTIAFHLEAWLPWPA